MPFIAIKDTEPFDVALRRFKRSCEKAGILAQLRQKESYEKPTTERKRKHAAAIKRWEKKLQKEKENMGLVRVERKSKRPERKFSRGFSSENKTSSYAGERERQG